MTIQTFEQKWRMFRLLVGIGFKQIEVSFPCSSQTEFDFTRDVIETPGAVPDDVTLEVITPCREETLKRAVDSLKGAKKAILFTYLAASDNYRETILQLTEDEWLERAKTCTEYARSITKDDPGAQDTEWSFGFGFEDFANARPEAVLRLAETIKAAWGPSEQNPIILGLASSVEATTPNVFADQVEHFSRSISDRGTVCISIHTHNDRGGAVASAELACLAGGDRVEGCLFGNGERAGNLDLVTCALNFFTQGIDPGLNLTNLHEIRRVYEDISKIPVHPRTPYSGDYYFRAFSGAHQDAICKGLDKRTAAVAAAKKITDGSDRAEMPAWRVPYLPLDPADLGLGFDWVIGVSSQSGKGGVAWLIQQGLGFSLPHELAATFSRVVKARSDALGRGLAAEEVCTLFLELYHMEDFYDFLTLRRPHNDFTQLNGIQQPQKLATVATDTMSTQLSRVLNTHVRSISTSSHSIDGDQGVRRIVAFSKCEIGNLSCNAWGVGVGPEEKVAVLHALLSAIRTSGQVDLPGLDGCYNPKFLGDSRNDGTKSHGHTEENVIEI